MPSARSRLADIESPGLGKKLDREGIEAARFELRNRLTRFLVDVDANGQQYSDAYNALADLIADATARQLRELEESEE
jgi:hypothetical protein